MLQSGICLMHVLADELHPNFNSEQFLPAKTSGSPGFWIGNTRLQTGNLPDVVRSTNGFPFHRTHSQGVVKETRKVKDIAGHILRDLILVFSHGNVFSPACNYSFTPKKHTLFSFSAETSYLGLSTWWV